MSSKSYIHAMSNIVISQSFYSLYNIATQCMLEMYLTKLHS